MATDHRREQGSLLAAPERRLLIWIAGRLPASINSDHLTLLALAAIAAAGAAFAAARYEPAALWLVAVALAANWFGDSLDGTLARVRHHERPHYGFSVDHVLDVVGTSLLMAGLAVSGFMTASLAFGELAVYLLVAAEVFLATASRGVFRMSFLWFGPTEPRIVLAIGAVALLRDPRVDLGMLGRYRLFDVGGVAAAAGLLIALIGAVVSNAATLARLEPRRPCRPGLQTPRGVWMRDAGSEDPACR